MGHHVGGQAHAPQHEEDAERRRRYRKRQTADQGAAEEAEFEGGDQQVVQGAGLPGRPGQAG
jgi:hypothetical protein